MSETFYRVNEIAEKFEVHVKTVLQWIRKGDLPAVKIGKSYRVSEEQFHEFLEKNKTN